MKDLDFRVSFSARHLRTQRSRLIGFVTDQVATLPFAGGIIQGAQDAARLAGCMLMIVDAGVSSREADRAVEELLEREVEGIIYATHYHRAVALPESMNLAPTVLANCFAASGQFPAFVPDEVHGAWEATSILASLGHRRIAFMNVHEVSSAVPASVGRIEGYRRALEQAGIEFLPELALSWGAGGAGTGYEMARIFLSSTHRPTAFFCGNDRMAMGAYQAAAEAGLRIPEDLAIIGFDDQSIISESLRPSLSTMKLPHYEMGRLAVEQLTNLPLASEKHLVACPFVARHSHKEHA